MEFADAVAELLRYSLVDRGEGNLRVHRLVQAVLRAKLPAEQRVARATDVVTLLRRVAPPVPTDPDGWTTWAVLAPHITALLNFSEDLNALPTGLVAGSGRVPLPSRSLRSSLSAFDSRLADRRRARDVSGPPLAR